MAIVTPDKLPELVMREISEKIIRNELKPGERIYETKLADELGVSRSPIREALRILEKNRLVELIPRKGARVTEITSQHIDWFYDIFEALYGMVARRATERATAEDLRAMWAALAKIEKAAEKGDVQAYYDGIFIFAGVARKASRNPLLAKMLLELWPSNRRIQYASLMYRKSDLNRNVAFFQRLAKHASEGEPDAAARIVGEYARNEKAFALDVISGRAG